jgi:hypothetical protein
MRIDSSSGKSTGSRFAICSGLHELAQRPALTAAVPPPDPSSLRPGHGLAVGRADRAGEPILHVVTKPLVRGEPGRLRALSSTISMPLRDDRPIHQHAAAGRGVAAQLTRETVDGSRPRCRAISRTPYPYARQIAISSRSAKDK